MTPSAAIRQARGVVRAGSGASSGAFDETAQPQQQVQRARHARAEHAVQEPSRTPRLRIRTDNSE
jgi:hypothetical protein